MPFIYLERGVRDVAYKDGDKVIFIPERIPELVVPDLTDFKVISLNINLEMNYLCILY